MLYLFSKLQLRKDFIGQAVKYHFISWAAILNSYLCICQSVWIWPNAKSPCF